MKEMRFDLARGALVILGIFGLIGVSLWVLRPFLAATVWAAMIVVATWPAFRAMESYLGGRRAIAIAGMSLAMLVLLVLPLWLAVDTLVEHAGYLTSAGKHLAAEGLPAPPMWVASLPLIGERLSAAWAQLAASGSAGMVARATPYAVDAGQWLFAQVGGLGGMLVQFLLVIVIAAIFYANGEIGAKLLRRFGHRLAGERGEASVVLAGQAIRGVALGVGVTALVQTVLGGLGLVLAGVPLASLLSAIMLMLCVAQIGPMPVLLPVVGWMFWQDDTGWAIFLLLWSLVVTSLDNFIRPVLIRRGADLPLLLIFAGVIGGMLSFGLIGLFVGPVVLAVTWTLLLAWMNDVSPSDACLGESAGEESAPH